MPQGTTLSEIERASIVAYRESGVPNSEIAATLNRHWKTITNFLKDPESYTTTKRTGAKPKFEARGKRNLLQEKTWMLPKWSRDYHWTLPKGDGDDCELWKRESSKFYVKTVT